MRRLNSIVPLVLLTTAAGFSLLPQPANAVGEGSIDVSATVVATCNVIDVIDLTFGDYDPTAVGDTSATAGFSVSCTTPANVDVSIGGGGSPDGAQRRMSDGVGNVLVYDLYQDSSGATPFAIDATTEVTVTSTGPTPVTVYGVVPAGEFVQTGNYTDTVLINLDF